MSERRGILSVTPELLTQLLHLPEGVNILDARHDGFRQVVELLITGPMLPELPENEATPMVRALFTKTLGESAPREIYTCTIELDKHRKV